jgi:hypothetical protein
MARSARCHALNRNARKCLAPANGGHRLTTIRPRERLESRASPLRVEAIAFSASTVPPIFIVRRFDCPQATKTAQWLPMTDRKARCRHGSPSGSIGNAGRRTACHSTCSDRDERYFASDCRSEERWASRLRRLAGAKFRPNSASEDVALKRFRGSSATSILRRFRSRSHLHHARADQSESVTPIPLRRVRLQGSVIQQR